MLFLLITGGCGSDTGPNTSVSPTATPATVLSPTATPSSDSPYNQTAVINDCYLKKLGGTGNPVIFIHGMSENVSNWNNWLSFLKDRGFYDKHEVWVYQYDWTKHIQENGNDLLNRIKGLNLQAPPLLIGHSMGGLVSRSYIAQGGAFTKLVTLGTPNSGSPLADIGTFIVFNHPGPKDLSPTSDFIVSINTNQTDINSRNKYYTWGTMLKGHWEGPVWIWDGDYSNAMKVSWTLMSGDNDGLVQLTSALLDGSNIQPVQYIDHFQYLEPDKSQDISSFIINL